MADQEDREQQVAQFVEMTGATPEQAVQYLGAHSWDIMTACNSYYQDEDEGRAEGQGESTTEAVNTNYTGPRTLDGRPAPQAASSRSAQKSTAQPKKRGIATLGSLGSSHHQHDDHDDDSDEDFDDDDDDDGRGNLFAGGEKSGLAVQDPKQEGGSKKLINDILAKAKKNSTRPDPSSDAGPSQSSFFRGTGVTLGGEGVESRSIPDPLGPSPSSNAEPQERVLHIWQDGFSIDDGELRRFDDPANMADLQMIRQGRAPLHLMNVSHNAPVDVKLQQHETPYQAPPKKYKPFGGSGRRLGSPVPGDGNEASSSIAEVASSQAPAAPASTAPASDVDSSQPTVSIRIQLPDGTRLPARFNTTQTIGDLYQFIQGASADTRTRPWVLATTFPNKEHTDKSLVLGDMAEFKKGGTAVVKWK
ncbi:unnamed protein product [Clonostachys byssicola]|uniref:UBX domain-containing protein 1 n=1 Tax=Clonostachys byssicola TaxID=160290 RepID=A0A9N9XXX5_9HYPO|nr:unnamed protein product [Clonostachys byssicola]